MNNYDIIYSYIAGGDVKDTEALDALNAMQAKIDQARQICRNVIAERQPGYIADEYASRFQEMF